ncbi:MAG: competence/damage-inducible protein A [Phycisphaerae bacterium]|nr:competence/damage-inducible protein A [Phycisphaerae bacterium]
MIAEIISVGSELTTGMVTDTNSAWLSRKLAELGIMVARHTTVSDDRESLREAMQASSNRSDVVIINGGLGPTRDDLTRYALAEVLGQPLESHPQAQKQIEAFFVKLGRPPSAADHVQALIPKTAAILENTIGTAPGIEARVGKCRLFCLPGVPREMKRMFWELAARMAPQGQPPRPPVVIRSLHTFGSYEADLGRRIEHFMTPGRNPAVGTTASDGIISIRIVAQDTSQTPAEVPAGRDERKLREVLGDLVFGAGDDTLASVVACLLTDRRLTISTAESCTGGLLAKNLTDIPGSSVYMIRGYVTYSNESKIELLGVPVELLQAHGAVSAEVARAMAVGCRRRSGTDLAVSTTGIAGPGGGTVEKPVGLVYIALADRNGVEVRQCRFGAHLPRAVIRGRACKTALNMVRLGRM